jgi:hypothetical protein
MTATEKIKRDEIEKVHAVLSVIRACTETIREFGRAPESAIFLAVQAKGIGLGGYERIRDVLVGTKLVKIVNHEYIWVGTDLHPAKA